LEKEEHMSVNIRHALADDAALLSNLGRQTYSDTFSDQNTTETMALYLADAFSPEKQAAELADPGSIFLIAEEDGRAVGYARLKVGPAPDCVTGSHPIEIIRFYSVKEYIGHGLGAVLMTACLETAGHHGCDVIWLDVWKENPRGIAFYKKWGFAIVGEQGFQMGEEIQEDWIMARPHI
jgi:GNAT superfamily N-acetyltransferase